MSKSHENAYLPPLKPRRFRAFRTISALILREMSTTYGRSAGGYIWAVISPIAAITLLTLVFSAALRSPSLGSNFPLFYATGMLPFTLYMQTSQKIAFSLKFSRPLLHYPGVRYIDTIIARFLLNLLTHITIFYLLISIIIFAYDIQTILNFPKIITALGLASLLGLGIGCLNCYLFMRFPVWGNLWEILNTPMFILSCIFFIFEDVPNQFQNYLWFNPLSHITGLMRAGFYPTYDATYVSISYVLLISFFTMALGILLLNRFHRDILNN